MTRWTRRVSGGVVAAVLAVVGPLQAQGPGYPEITAEDELRLALSAGPPSLSGDADVWLMGPAGFEKLVDGSNGFACLVVRSAANKGVLAPHCLNDAAVETVLPSMLREAELQARGMSAEEIDAELRRQWDGGALPLPSGPAYAYMLSEGQRIGPRLGNFRPHFMLYVPYVTNEAIGGDPANPAFPFVGPVENHPLSTVVILMEEFVDPADIALPTGR